MKALAIPVALISAALTGCIPQVSPPETRPLADGCPVLGSRGWSATLDKMPGPDAGTGTLSISGEIDLPTPGYSVTLTAGPADRMMPPSQRFRLTATPPGGMTAQVVTATPVAYRAKADYPSYRSIVILCGDRALTTISDIAEVH